ncbi:hypothetical protein IL992_07615 [Microbispora sp. NEAU-D428]|uniref:hypothetical protein n=1 Tax=Microbispora sitophila TaxID=2771537 RepID=UPI001868718E|nr:hypothetical protein [Microbispora sitophila]MBE3009059.1 hypothetical protein [Microbispora sitophila]
MSTELVEERPFDARLHKGELAAQGRCSWHGRTCQESVVASVLTRHKGGDVWHAVCRSALNTLRKG